MTYVVISDTHLHNWSQFAVPTESGVNSRLQQILESIDEAARAARDVSPDDPMVYHGGDLFHVRGSLTPSVLNAVLDYFKALHDTYGVRFRMIAGNHDLETKDSCPMGNAAAALNSLPFVEVVSSKTLFSDHKVALLPWRDSMDDLRADMASVKTELGDSASDWTAIIHAPVNGVVIGIPDHGFDGKELASYGFGLVLCGHYHNHKRVFEGVYSIGALTHQTWGDVNSLAGYVIVDDSLRVTLVSTAAPRFVDYDYLYEHECEGNYVRVKLEEASESEIKKIREHVTKLGALGVVIHATPATPSTVRTGATVEAGKSVLGSIEAWLKEQEVESVKEVLRECENILNTIEVH